MSEWISVEEKLPEMLERKHMGSLRVSDPVLAFGSRYGVGGGDPSRHVATCWSNGEWYDADDTNYKSENVTHWQPLPDLPKEK